MTKQLGKYSFGLGDRFGRQGRAQLNAIIAASERSVEINPVWNKSNREHNLTGTSPEDVRTEADTVTQEAGYDKPYFVDADHININTVDKFIDSSDFFTIDVAAYINKPASDDSMRNFMEMTKKDSFQRALNETITSSGFSSDQAAGTARKYLFAVEKASEIYKRIEQQKGTGNFITEISMDEVAEPQTPGELLFICYMLALAGIPAQTIAPRFPGKFNKGVDYTGDPIRFMEDFEKYLTILDISAKEFGLPGNLKLSIHSGSDKFSLYPLIGSAIRRRNKGIHIKTAGTTWLEEITGLAESGGEGLEFVKELYNKALSRYDELCAPYSEVIDIQTDLLPGWKDVKVWTASQFSEALKHVPGSRTLNPHLRQLMHVAYKIAAEQYNEFYRLLEANESTISACVFGNIYDRHISRIFGI